MNAYELSYPKNLLINFPLKLITMITSILLMVFRLFQKVGIYITKRSVNKNNRDIMMNEE